MSVAQFSEAAGQRIRAAVEYVERSGKNAPGPRANGPSGSFAAIKHCVVTAAISAAAASSGTTAGAPGSGTVLIQDWDSAAGIYRPGISVTAYNDDSAGPVAVGTFLKVCWQDGDWFVIWDLC